MLIQKTALYPSLSSTANQRRTALFQRFHKFFSAVLEWVKKTSDDQHCFTSVQRWLSLNQCGIIRSCKMDEKYFSSVWEVIRIMEKTLEYSSYEKVIFGKNLVEKFKWSTVFFFKLQDRTLPV